MNARQLLIPICATRSTCNFICLSITKLSSLLLYIIYFIYVLNFSPGGKCFSLFGVCSINFCRSTDINSANLTGIYDLIGLNCLLINFVNFCTPRKCFRFRFKLVVVFYTFHSKWIFNVVKAWGISHFTSRFNM